MLDGLKLEESPIFKNWLEADKYYQKVGSTIRKNPFIKLQTITP